jgi:pimeloyl-ACP methyl ester carboxylesterase
MNTLDHTHVSTNGVRLHVVTAGPPDGEMLLLLHGFPESWRGWSEQIDVFAQAGYFVVAPDQCGYTPSSKPPDVSDYRLQLLVDDAVGLLDHFGRNTASVVGHDWGGIVAWWMAVTAAHRLRCLVVVNAPHPGVFHRVLWTDFRQVVKSWYVFFFQLPDIPEQLLHMYAVVWSRLGRLAGRPWAGAAPERSTLDWYRALFRYPPIHPVDQRVSVPTLVVWGTGDAYLLDELAQQSVDLCESGVLEKFEMGGHSVHQEQPSRVNPVILGFLGVGS